MTNSCWFCSRRINKPQSEKSTFCRWQTFLLLHHGTPRTKTMQPQRGFLLSRGTNLRFFSSIKFKYTHRRTGFTSQTLSDKELSNIRGGQIKQMKSFLSATHSLFSYPGNMFHHCSYVKPFFSLYI